MKRLIIALAALCALFVPNAAGARVINIELFRSYRDFSGREYFKSNIDTTNFHASDGDTIIAVVEDWPGTREFDGLINFNPPKNDVVFVNNGVSTIEHTAYDSTIIDEGVVVLTNAQFQFNGNVRIGRPGGKPVKFIATGMRAHRSSSGGTIDKRAGILVVGNLEAYGLEITGFGGENYQSGGGIMLARGAKALICDSKTRNLIGIRAPFTNGNNLPKSGEITINTVRCTFTDSVTNFFIDLDEGVTYHDEGSQFHNKESWLKLGKFPPSLSASQYDTATTTYLNTYGRYTATFSGPDIYQAIVDDILDPWRPIPGDPDFMIAGFNSLQRVVQLRIINQSPKPNSDFNGSGLVDFDDFFLFADAFGKTAAIAGAKFDLNGNGLVDFDDFFVFADAFGRPAGKKVAAKPVVATPDQLARLLVIARRNGQWQDAVQLLLPRETNTWFYDQLDSRLPQQFTLAQNFPNPFNPSTTISYTLPEPANVHLAIYSLTGQMVMKLVSEPQSAGRYNVSWDAVDDSGHRLASGTYYYRLTAGSRVETRRMLLLK